MKKYLIFFFFIIFISIVFMWDEEHTGFWMNEENRYFLLNEGVTWFGRFSFMLDFLHTYRYLIVGVGLGYFVMVFFIKKRGKPVDENKHFHGDKIIHDANQILSKESLPESEKKRERKIQETPPLITKKHKEKKSISPVGEDLDKESMRKMLDVK